MDTSVHILSGCNITSDDLLGLYFQKIRISLKIRLKLLNKSSFTSIIKAEVVSIC